MAFHAAYKTSIKISGTPTDFTDEATKSISALERQISNASKQVFNRDYPLIVKDDGIVVSDYTVDYLFGIIKFSVAPKGKVTLTGQYVPLGRAVGAHQYSLEFNSDLHDKTDFGDEDGHRSRMYGLADVSASISNYYDVKTVYKDRVKDGANVVVEIRPGNGNEVIRGWFLVESASNSGDVSSLETESVQLQLNAEPKTSFSWRTI